MDILFKLGDRVRITRLDDEMTSKELIGLEGEIVDVDDLRVFGDAGPSFGCIQVNYEVKTEKGIHYMHQQELELVPGGQDARTG
jgi:hypothetical protein